MEVTGESEGFKSIPGNCSLFKSEVILYNCWGMVHLFWTVGKTICLLIHFQFACTNAIERCRRSWWRATPRPRRIRAATTRVPLDVQPHSMISFKSSCPTKTGKVTSIENWFFIVCLLKKSPNISCSWVFIAELRIPFTHAFSALRCNVQVKILVGSF